MILPPHPSKRFRINAGRSRGARGRPSGGCFAVSVLAAGTLLGGLVQSASAADHPRLNPSRDVTVVYDLSASSQTPDAAKGPRNVKVAFSGSGNFLRIDSADGNGVTILDRLHQQVTLIMMNQKAYTRLHPAHGLHNPFMLDLDMTYTPSGRQKIAGVSCQAWNVQSSRGKATACVTDDGVILAESGIDADGVEGTIRAVSVTYADVPDSAFEPPADFHALRLHPRSSAAVNQEVPDGTPAPGAETLGTPVPGAARVDGGVTTIPKGPDADPPVADDTSMGTHDAPAPSTTTAGQSAANPALSRLPGQTDQSEPPVSNDSATDGSISVPDQPPTGPSQQDLKQ